MPPSRGNFAARTLLPPKARPRHGADPPWLGVALQHGDWPGTAPEPPGPTGGLWTEHGAGILERQRSAARVLSSVAAMQAARTAAQNGPRRTWYRRVLLEPPSRGRSVRRPAAWSLSITGRTRLSLSTSSCATLRVVTKASSAPESRSMAATTSAKNRLPNRAAERSREAACSSAGTCVV